MSRGRTSRVGSRIAHGPLSTPRRIGRWIYLCCCRPAMRLMQTEARTAT
jgi:hypothetical protein